VSGDGRFLWIEILSRHDAVAERHRLECGSEIRIGRGYDNHVILDDPFVAGQHLRIVRDENGALVAEDLGSANGLFVGEDRRRVARTVLDARRIIRIGRTRLRVRQAGDAVEPERIAHARMRMWPIALVLAVALLGVEQLSTWLRETTERELTDYLGTLVTLGAAVTAWSSAWALLSRIFSGRARFERHLVIALSGLLALSLLNELGSHAAYAFSRREFVAYRYVVLWMLAAFVCFLHLRQLSLSRETARVRLKLKAATVTLLALLAIAMQTLSQWESSQNSDRQTYLRNLKPPEFRLASAVSQPAFFARVEKLKGELDRARSEPPSRVWDYGGDDDD
jgi:FHA domain